jgi:tripartite-type tricarboxylate transporter receptor subunit TctC
MMAQTGPIGSETAMKVATVLAAIVSVAACTAASAQDYPTKPIKLIIPYAAGGPSDVIARLLTQRMSQILGQSFVLENRGGAGGSIGGRAAANSDPDGYTLMWGATGPLVISPIVFKQPDYDPAKAFVPIALVGTTSNILVVNPKLPVNSVQELLAYAKANPGKLSYSSPGVGTPPHMIGEMFKLKTGIDIVHVPYKGGGSATQDVIAGQVQMTFENPAVSLPLARNGSVRALAVTSDVRSSQIPELPTLIEAGIADFVSVSFTGLAAPVGTPDRIIQKLNAAVNESLKDAEVQSVLSKLAVDIRGGTPEEFGTYLARERAKWTEVAKAANIQTN